MILFLREKVVVLMLLLPMTLKDVTLNINLNFKDTVIKQDQLDAKMIGITPSDVIIDKYNLNSLDTKDYYDHNPAALTHFIRKNISYNGHDINTIQVTTKKYKDTDFYDVYTLPVPPYYQNDVTDYIYGSLVNSIRLNSQEKNKKRYLSLEKLGIDTLFSNEFITRASALKNKTLTNLELKDRLTDEGYGKQLEILDFFNNYLSCDVDNEALLLTSELDNVLDFFSPQLKEGKVLLKYKNIAAGNYDCYLLLGTLNNIIYNKPLDWLILSNEQQKTLKLKLDSNFKRKDD